MKLLFKHAYWTTLKENVDPYYLWTACSVVSPSLENYFLKILFLKTVLQAGWLFSWKITSEKILVLGGNSMETGGVSSVSSFCPCAHLYCSHWFYESVNPAVSSLRGFQVFSFTIQLCGGLCLCPLKVHALYSEAMTIRNCQRGCSNWVNLLCLESFGLVDWDKLQYLKEELLEIKHDFGFLKYSERLFLQMPGSFFSWAPKSRVLCKVCSSAK